MKDVRVELVVVSVRDRAANALLVRLPGSVWALPGAAVAPGVTLEAAAHAALADQTGVRGVALEQLYSFDRRGGEAVCVAHLGLVSAGRHPLAPGPAVVEVRWFPLDDLPALDTDATQVLEYGRSRVRAKAAYAPIALQLLPEMFTLGELQTAYEAVLGHDLDTRNFRRDVLAAGIVEPAGRSRADGPGRPAGLYRSCGGDFQVLARERRIARAIAGAPEPEPDPEPAGG
ncbi:NUDIX hydrolase [Miltoncostaea marina]|uniref:NUDIX hydrolase n=1 Tax=Miltoncostaea marina TaxID=2843215 RepID=UPI001C3DCE00|nr:NUDIX domain-containing protein [Miltoncostaea marina]